MSLKVVKFYIKMYLNFLIFQISGDELGGGDKPWSKNGDKCRMGGGIDKIFAGWGDPQSPREKKPWCPLIDFQKKKTIPG